MTQCPSILGKKLLMGVGRVFLLTTLKQELSGESGEEKRSQLRGPLVVLAKCCVAAGGLTHPGFI